MKERLFRFKQFSVAHSESAMKVGVDGVLAGAWSETSGNRILDVGTGCGLIALMLAQRYPEAELMAIDVDQPSVAEAQENVKRSAWSGRIDVERQSYMELCERIAKGELEKFDLVVSNPPYYDSGVTSADTPRLIARHQGELSPKSLLAGAPGILAENGHLCMIFPAEMYDDIHNAAILQGMIPVRLCYVKDREGKDEKRLLADFILRRDKRQESATDFEESQYSPQIRHLVMFGQGQEPTPEYRKLCGDFYLRF